MSFQSQISVSAVLMAAVGTIAIATAQAQPANSQDHSAHHPSAGATAPQAPGAASMTDGEVRRVDRDTGRITIRHGEIKNLDMPPMTMVFRVKDPALLDKAKEGDRVRFSVDRIDGAFTVTAIEAAP